MKKIYIYILLLASLLLCNTSCDSFLDEMPDNRTEVDSEEKITALLVSAYPRSSPAMMIAELSSDNVDDNGSRWSAYDSRFTSQLYNWQDITESDTDNNYYVWSYHYEAIASANTALAAIEAMGSPKSLNAQKGEALICRAYCHFVLANVFCKAYGKNSASDMGIPYAIAPETTVNPKYERGTVEEVYAKINADVEAALPLIDDNLYKVAKYHFNKKAAYAFAARFNLYYSASNNNQERLDKVITYANQALTADPLALTRDWKTLYSTTNFEIISNSYINASNKANFLIGSVYSLWGRTYGAASTTRGSKYSHNVFVSESETLKTGGPLWTRNDLHMKSYGFTGYPKQFALKFIEYFEITDPVARTGFARNVFPLFTADETLLCRAEAYALKNDLANATKDIHLFMTKFSNITPANLELNLSKEKIVEYYKGLKYYTPSAPTPKKRLNPDFTLAANGDQENMIHCILHLRRNLTIHEGLRWFDVKRYGIEIYRRVLNETGGFDKVTDTLTKEDGRRAIQIPSDVLSAGMPANPR